MRAAVTMVKCRVGGSGGAVKTFKGRMAWALDHLIAAGSSGCTPIDQPAPRWSDYIFKLRREGVAVETIHETHGGPYSGNHARYRLQSPVEVIERQEAA